MNSEFAVLAFEVVVDVDGDGDADDDNKRGKRGQGNNNGHGDGDDDDDDSNDDSDDDDGNDDSNDDGDDDDGSDDSDSITVGAEISLVAEDSDLNGKAEIKYRSENGNVEQELEIELEDATAGAIYTILVFFGDESVTLGSITANDLGVVKAEYETGSDDPDRDLSALLPDGRDVRDITGVQILLDDNVVLDGDF